MMDALKPAERPPRDQARGGDFQPNTLPRKAAAGIERANHKRKETNHVTGRTVVHIAGGKIVEEFEHSDYLGFLQQLGVVPPLG